MGVGTKSVVVKRTKSSTDLQIKPVWFLGMSSDTDLELLFPAELEEEYYTGGLFIVECSNPGEPDWQYEFIARRGPNLESITLSQSERLNATQRFSRTDRVFTAEAAGLGSFLFIATPLNRHRTRKIEYKGSSSVLQKHNELWVLSPANPELHEQAVREYDFYFLGAVGI